MSGLDPLGRREVRDILFAERSAGRTVLFSSHVLSDVEALCDRVIILRKGRVVVAGRINELIRKEATLREVVLRGVTDDQKPTIESHGRLLRFLEGELAIEIEGEAALRALLQYALAQNLSIQSILPRFDSLEDLFMRNAVSEGTE
jgi:ABC-2 type transport system ATP-binding protein